MRALKWILALVILIPVVVVAGGLVYLQTADLSKLVVSQAKSRAGLSITAEGPLTVKLFPRPVLHATKLTVNAPRGGKPLFKVDEADVTLAWGGLPTFWKGVTLTTLKLANPTVYLAKPATGPANWQTDEAYADSQKAAADKDAKPAAPMDQLPIASFGVIDVSNLNLTYADAATGRNVTVSGLNLKADGTNLADAHLDLLGKVNGSTVSGTAVLGFQDLSRIPVTASLVAADLKLALDGEVQKQNSYAGAINVQTPNLKGSLDSLLGKAPAQAPASPFTLTGDVSTGGETLSLKNFNAALGTLLKATGDVDVKLGRNGSGSPSASGTFMASGSNLRQLAALATGKDNPALPSAPFKVATALTGDNEIVLKNLSAELTNIVSLNGDVSIVPASKPGDLPKVDGQLGLRGASLAALGNAFGHTGLPAQPFSAGAKVSGQGTYTVSDINAQLATLATVAGDLKITPQPALQLSGNLKLQGNDLATTAKAFGVAGNLPRSSYSAGFTIGGSQRIEITDLNVSLPQLVEATGEISLAPAAPHDIKAKINVSRLNLDALGYCAPKANGGATAETASTAAPAASATPWSDEPLPFASLNGNTFDVTVKVDNLSCASFPARSLELFAANTATTLNVSKLHVETVENGSLDVTANLTHGGSSSNLKATLSTDRLPVHQLVRTLADKGVVLPLSGKATLSSSGSTSRQLAQNLDGNLDFNATSGKVPYTNLLGNISNLAGLLQGKLPTQSDDSLQSLVAKYTLKNGLMTTDELSMKTGGLAMTGTGSVNLPAWSIDYTITPVANVGGEVSIPVNIKGSLGSPNIGPDKDFISKLSGRLATEGLKGALGIGKDSAKGIGGAVGDLLGGKGLQGEGIQNLLQHGIKGAGKAQAQPADASATTEPAPAPQQPANPLQNLMQNMLQPQGQ